MARSSGRKPDKKTKKKKNESCEVSSHSWRGMGAEERHQIVRKALQSQHQLTAAIEKLSNPPEQGSSSWFTDTIATLQDGSEGLQDFFSAFLKTRFFTERHGKDGNDQPHGIFEIVELVEQILGHLGIVALLGMRNVNRFLRDTIDHSDTLQRRLHIRPSKTGFLDAPFKTGSKASGLAGITCDVDPDIVILPSLFDSNLEGTPLPKTATISATCFGKDLLNFSVLSGKSPYREMLVCQPAPKNMVVHPSCCDLNPQISGLVDPFVLDPQKHINCETGITIGQLYDETVRTKFEHRLCPFAHKSSHGIGGYVNVDVRFRATIELQSDDPVFEHQQKKTKEMLEPPPWPPVVADRNEYLEAYIEAKQRAYAIGEPIPTLAEFEVIREEDLDIAVVFAQSNSMFDEADA